MQLLVEQKILHPDALNCGISNGSMPGPIEEIPTVCRGPQEQHCPMAFTQPLPMPDSTPPRLTMRDVFASVSETLNLDLDIFRTLLDLVISPQAFFQTYFFQDRSKYSKPMTLLLLMLASAVVSCRHFLPTNHPYSPNLFLTITASNQDESNRLTLIREYDDVLRLLLVPATSGNRKGHGGQFAI
jgi:hypothetical protein